MVEVVSSWLQSMPVSAALWIIVVIFIMLDFIAGTFKAVVSKTVSSDKARKGILHKMGFLLAMAMCTVIDVAQSVWDFGFTIQVLPLCAVMIVLCEVFSLCEHIREMNPDIKLDFLPKK